MWYAPSVIIAGFLVFYYLRPAVPIWVSMPALVIGTFWFVVWLHKFSHDWKPVALFVVGLVLSFAPIPVLHGLMERQPAVGALMTLVAYMAGPLLTLVALVWGFYRGYLWKHR